MTRRQSRLRLERLEDRSQPAVLSVRATLDTQLSALNPTGNYGSALSLAAGSAEQGLLRFDNLFGGRGVDSCSLGGTGAQGGIATGCE